MTASIAALAACGGGGGGSPTPAGPPATVTSATVTATSYNTPALVTVNGTNLDGTLVVASSACGSMTRLTAAPNASTSTTAYYDCTLSNYAGTVTVASSAGDTLGSATFTVPGPIVTSASATTTRFQDPLLLTVNGTNLDSGLVPSSPNCTSMTLLTAAPNASSSTTAYYHCTIAGAYSGRVGFQNAVGAAMLPTAAFTVPAPMVTMTVSGDGVSGNIVFALRGDKAPITVDNFLAYVNSGFYNGLIFHRVVPGFAVQGGGYGTTTSGTLPTPKATTFAPIALETTGGSNVQWTAAMARTSESNSATSQFFLNLADNASSLDPSASSAGYAVFADVSASAAVIQQIATAPSCTTLAGYTDGSCVPIPNVVITGATQTQ